MGRYVFAADLAALEGWQELAEAASADASVDGDALHGGWLVPHLGSVAARLALARLEQHVDAAEGIVDSYLLSVDPDYPTRGASDPLSPVGARALDIALERVFGPGSEQDGFARRARKDEAVAWLRALAKGEVQLPDADGDDEPDAGSSGILIDAPERVFTRQSLAGFTRSSVS